MSHNQADSKHCPLKVDLQNILSMEKKVGLTHFCQKSEIYLFNLFEHLYLCDDHSVTTWRLATA